MAFAPSGLPQDWHGVLGRPPRADRVVHQRKERLSAREQARAPTRASTVVGDDDQVERTGRTPARPPSKSIGILRRCAVPVARMESGCAYGWMRPLRSSTANSSE